jgi:hypothetical protein
VLNIQLVHLSCTQAKIGWRKSVRNHGPSKWCCSNHAVHDHHYSLIVWQMTIKQR